MAEWPDGSAEFDFSADTFDSRELIARIDYLESIAVIDREPDEQEELDDLSAFAEEAADYVPDWKYGETFIREDYFTEYAQALAEDIGATDPKATWPLNRIDWKAAAADLQIDYTGFELRGVTWYAR